jgi:hypothetical protein
MTNLDGLTRLNMNPGHTPGKRRRNLNGSLVGLDLK